jgi:hypothetical protein
MPWTLHVVSLDHEVAAPERGGRVAPFQRLARRYRAIRIANEVFKPLVVVAPLDNDPPTAFLAYREGGAVPVRLCHELR